MLLEVMMAVAAPAYEMMAHPSLSSLGAPTIARASLSIPDTLFLFVVALVVFGPKRLPEIGKQIGKLVFEFRRASNDFKLQIEEELRLSERQEKQKQMELQAASVAPVMTATSISAPISESAAPAIPAQAENEQNALVIQPPSSGALVEAEPPNRFRTAEPVPDAPEVQKVEAGLEQSSTPEDSQSSPAEGTPAHHA
jgi:sec-independent protein translocase protein TatB